MITFEQTFKKSIESIRFSAGEKALLCSRLEEIAALQKKGDVQMNKKKTYPRAAVIAAALILATAATVFAAGKISSIASHSRSSYDYTSVEEINRVLKKADITAFPETLGTVFEMEGGNLVTNEGLDEENTVVDSWESISVAYKDKEDRTLYVDVSPVSAIYGDQSSWPEPTEKRIIQNTEVRYDHTEHLMVPPDYEVDEETKKRAEEDEHFAIAYGAPEPETMFFDTVRFTVDDTVYEIITSDGVTGNELFVIAEQLIER